jgi:predicted lipoprotein
MGDDRSRWSDERLDDNISIVHDELRALREIPKSVADLAMKVERIEGQVDGCFEASRATRQQLEDYVAGEERRRKEKLLAKEALAEKHRLERKSDRRWLVATGISSAGIVIAALALFLR